MESMVIRGKYRILLSLAVSQILTMYGTLTISHLSYISISHKATLISCGKMSSRASRPLGLVVSLCPTFRPPPLCGAVPAEPNHIGRTGDKVAARVRASDGEENWILAEVVSYSGASNKYDVDDIDAEEGKE